MLLKLGALLLALSSSVAFLVEFYRYDYGLVD